MKRLTLLLTLLPAVFLTSCNSDHPTEPLDPGFAQTVVGGLLHDFDPQQLVGRWEGSYLFVGQSNHAALHRKRFDIELEFTDSTFAFREESCTGVCCNYGGGPFWVEDRTISLEDQSPRNGLCLWYFIHGDFSYRTNRDVTILNLSQRSDNFRVQIRLKRVE